MPSALSARTPPMPSTTSCWMRVSRSPPYRRAESSRSQARSPRDRYRAGRARPGRGGRARRSPSTDRSPSGTAMMHGLPVRRRGGVDRRVVPVQALVAFFLPALAGQALVEVTLRVHEPDADERHAEVRRFLAVIAGEHAEAARVDRQRLMERELGGEVGDRLAGEMRHACASTRCFAPLAHRRGRRWRDRRARGTPGSPPPARASTVGTVHSIRTGLCAVVRQSG